MLTGSATISTPRPLRSRISRGGELPAIRSIASGRTARTAGMISPASHRAASRFGRWAKVPAKRIVPGASRSRSAAGGRSMPYGLTRRRPASSGARSRTAAASPSVNTWSRSKRRQATGRKESQRRQSRARSVRSGRSERCEARHSAPGARTASCSVRTAGTAAGNRSTAIGLSSTATMSNRRVAARRSIVACMPPEPSTTRQGQGLRSPGRRQLRPDPPAA